MQCRLVGDAVILATSVAACSGDHSCESCGENVSKYLEVRMGSLVMDEEDMWCSGCGLCESLQERQ